MNDANLTMPVNACLWEPVPWPVSWHRVFPGEASQVGEARRFLASCLAGCAVADDALACLSELAANAGAPRGALLYPRRSREELKGGSWA